MKKSPEFLVAVVVLALILIGFLIYMVGVPSSVRAPEGVATTTTVSQTTDTTLTKYLDPSNIYSFTYPNEFVLSGGGVGYSQDWMVNATTTGLSLVKVVIPQSFEPKTNFGDAKFTVGTSADPAAVAGCLAAPESGSPLQKSQVTIHGTSYAKYVMSDAGAGNLYKTTSYRTVHGGQCYAIEYTIHSSNIANYPTDSGIVAFDESKVQNIMEGIVQSFSFSS